MEQLLTLWILFRYRNNKHKVRYGEFVRFPHERLWTEYGLTRLATRTARHPWAKA